jgi:hypothetical protein
MTGKAPSEVVEVPGEGEFVVVAPLVVVRRRGTYSHLYCG